MMQKETIIEWLESLPEKADVAIDEGGLRLKLVEVEGDEPAYLEVGGEPIESEE